ncbi:DUF2461 domain-containing protein [uncultured Dokdonia sp.]|uniref:DUF2461 domain-containing protein n=1 Tax=uncultured Dokdonia sp. TaxID=575653 RepID=UPI0026301FCB|nr:DUF2461 domain-containing protein [uncultured Dokdonia sp.]
MGFPELFNFLERLQLNNTKEWMDLNRKEYQAVRSFFIGWLDELNAKLATVDPEYFDTPGKKAINRINNNLMFAPHKPIYKDHFGAGLDQLTKQGDFYIEMGLKQCLLAGGFWRPEKSILRSIRDAIDYNGDELIAIIEKPSFKKMFGGLYYDDPLKTAPKGFSKEHPYIDLLRRKTFAVEMTLSRKQILDSHYQEYCIEVYLEMLPFRRYLREAVTVQ